MKKSFLVICNAYPSSENIYRNGFIHRRVKSYLDKGHDVKIFYLHPHFYSDDSYIYDDVQVFKGNRKHYENFLDSNEFDNYLIHFINPDMYYPIVDRKENPDITVWIHGFEAEAWHRRWFNFLSSKQELIKVLNQSENYFPDQLNFMHDIYLEDKVNIKFIHVSRWFKENIADIDAKASPRNYEVIPNIVDGSLFKYSEKYPSKRLKILSIRPFASKKYANDLSVKAIQLLSKTPFFNELEFHFYGDGILFDRTLDSLKNYENVYINKGFLTQNEIADLHKDFGIFLCPTRLDSQGVSMCEAMSSGLVPISNNNTAIPEFVTHNVSGLLANSESPEHLAYQIERLFFNPELYKFLSRNAATSIRNKADEHIVISKELDVINNGI